MATEIDEDFVYWWSEWVLSADTVPSPKERLMALAAFQAGKDCCGRTHAAETAGRFDDAAE